jgi:uncharacterized membrane protein YbhN (UPF0104 family)
MSEAVPAPSDPVRPRWKRLLIGAVVIAVLWVIVDLAGWDVRSWFHELWHDMTSISLGYLVAGLFFQVVQTVAVAYGWLWILRYGYPNAVIPFRPVLASYAVGVALNGWLPANIGTFVMMFLFLTFIAGSTFAGVFAGFLVQKIFFTAAGTFVYLYLFLSVPGSFDIELGNISAHPFFTLAIVAGGAMAVLVVVRILWRKMHGLWEKAKVGGRILTYPRIYATHVLTPQLVGWLAKLAVVGIFLAAYGIPVTFHTIMSVVGGNSLANVASFTPGAVGITQAVNSASLSKVTDPTTAAAYSLGQQLVTTAWNQIFAIVMLVSAFGWTGGKQLVRDSYGQAKEKAAEQQAARQERKLAKRNHETAEEDA